MFLCAFGNVVWLTLSCQCPDSGSTSASTSASVSATSTGAPVGVAQQGPRLPLKGFVCLSALQFNCLRLVLFPSHLQDQAQRRLRRRHLRLVPVRGLLLLCIPVPDTLRGFDLRARCRWDNRCCWCCCALYITRARAFTTDDR